MTAPPSRLVLPGQTQRLLLHACCAPCSGDVIARLLASRIDFAIFFYNPNIHPEHEYLRRKAEIERFARQNGISFLDADHDPAVWMARAKALKWEPERGARCSLCFDLRLGQTAHYAAANRFDVIASTLGISRCKDVSQVNASGLRAVQDVCGPVCRVEWWPFNWRKEGGATRTTEIARREGFYRQSYCGCVYSLRDMLRRRAEAAAATRNEMPEPRPDDAPPVCGPDAACACRGRFAPGNGLLRGANRGDRASRDAEPRDGAQRDRETIC